MEKNIVIIDNNLLIRETLKNLVTRLNRDNSEKLNLYTSQNGIEGLGFVYITHPELIIIDTTLPKYSGNELLYFLLTNKQFHTDKVKVVVITEKKQNLRVPANFCVINKTRRDFIEELVKNINNTFDSLTPQSEIVRINKKGNTLIRVANKSDLLRAKLEKETLLNKIWLYPYFLLFELLSSFLLSLSYFVFGHIPDSNVKQDKRDIALLRRRHYPTVIASTVSCLIFAFVAIGFILSQKVILNQTEEQTSALGTIYWYSFMSSSDEITAPFEGKPAELLNSPTFVTVGEDTGVQFDADTEVVRINAPVLDSDYSLNKGAVEFFYSPLEAHTVDRELTFFSIYSDANNKIDFKKLNDGSDSLSLSYSCIDCGTVTEKVAGSNYLWTVGEWTKLRVEWDYSQELLSQLKIFVDDVQPASTESSSLFFEDAMTEAVAIYIGNSSTTGTNEANGVITSLAIYSEGYEPTATPVGTPAPTSVYYQNSGTPGWYSNINSVQAVTTPAYGSSGSVTGGTFINGPLGYGNALKFNADADSIDVNVLNGIDYSLEEGAVEFYYNPLYDSNHNAEINLFSIRTDDNNEIRLYKKANPGNELALAYSCTGTCSGEELIAEAQYGSLWNIGEWIFFRVEWDDSQNIANQLKIYMNGTQPTSTNQAGAIEPATFGGTPVLYIGNRTTSGTNEALGTIDEFKIYLDTTIPTPTPSLTPSPTLTPSITPSPSITPTATVAPIFYTTLNNQSAVTNPVLGVGADVGNIVGVEYVTVYGASGAYFGPYDSIEFSPSANNIDRTKGRFTFRYKADYFNMGGTQVSLFSIRKDNDNYLTLQKKEGQVLVATYKATTSDGNNMNELIVQPGDFYYSPTAWVEFELIYDISKDVNQEIRLFMNGVELPHTHTSGKTVTTAMQTPTQFFIGSLYEDLFVTARGVIDDFKYYNYYPIYPTATTVLISNTPTPLPAESILWYSTLTSSNAITTPVVGTAGSHAGGLTFTTTGTPDTRLAGLFNGGTIYGYVPVTQNDYNISAGRVEFWYRPVNAANEDVPRELFRFRDSNLDKIYILRNANSASNALDFVYDSSCTFGQNCGAAGEGAEFVRRVRINLANYSSYWTPNRWMKFTAVWDNNASTESEKLRLFIDYYDGSNILHSNIEPTHTDSGTLDPTKMGVLDNLWIGNRFSNGASANGSMREFKVWGVGAGATPTPSVTPQPTTPAQAIWYSTLNDANAITTPAIGKGASSSSVTYESAINGNGARIDANSEHITVTGLPDTQFIKSKGAVEFYYKPDAEETTNSNLALFNVGSNTSNYLRLTKLNNAGSNKLQAEYKIGGSSKTLDVAAANYQNTWVAGQWLLIRLEWDEAKSASEDLKLFINRVQVTPTIGANQFTAGAGVYSLTIGNIAPTQAYNTLGVIDEFSIYGDPDSRIYTVNDTGDATDSIIGDKVCSTAGGVCTLRAAIVEANASTAADKITFNIAGGGVKVITPATALPAISNEVIIDGASQSGSNCSTSTVMIALDGTQVGSDGISITANNVTVNGLAIYKFSNGIKLTTNNNLITCNIIGLDADGSTLKGNSARGIYVLNTSNNNVIGGTTIDTRNIISGNGKGVVIETSNNSVIKGNFIGTDKTGLINKGNTTSGIEIYDSGNIDIGGTTGVSRSTQCQGDCNLISGNGGGGITLMSGTTGNSSVDVKGNYIGLNVSGTGSINNYDGIRLSETATIDIDNNLITASLHAINATSFSGANISGITLNNNYIGVDKSGTSLLQSGNTGIVLFASSSSSVSSVNITNNIIGGMSLSGIYVYGTGASSVAIKSNYIGTNASNATLGNKYGIWFYNPNALGGSANSIGGSTAPEGNTVAHNTSYGIYLASASNIAIRKNTIHTNGNDGISISGVGSTGSVDNTIIENSIYDNTELGINLRVGTDLPSGVTQNDTGDSDTTIGNDGPNNLQNYPILVNAIYEGTTLQLYGAFNSEASKYYRLDFYSSNTNDTSAFGEGKNHFHTLTGISGNGYDFSTTPLTITSLNLPAGHKYISATATECVQMACSGLLSTSEFGHTAFETVMLAKNIMINEDTDQLFIAAEGNEYNADLFAFDFLSSNTLELYNSFDTGSLYTMSIAGLDEDNVAVVGADSTNQFKIYSLVDGYQCSYNISASGYKAVDISVAKNSVGSKYVYIISEDENEELTVIQGPDAGSNYYPKYGEYLSETHDFGANKRLHSITWDQNLLSGNVMLQLRAGTTSDLSNQEWYGPDGTRGTYFSDPSDGTNGEVIPDVLQGKQFVQYRLLVESNQQASPAFNSITIRYGD